MFQVKEIAQASGVTVRTLHHYDAIGLLKPTARSEGGYRLYSSDDLLRLQQILLHRSFGLSLEAIRRLLDDPNADRRATLLTQRTQIERRLQRDEALLRALDHALDALEGKDMDMKQLFEGFDPADFAGEAQARWGNTDPYREAARRTQSYREEDWRALKEENAAIMRELASARAAGHPPEDVGVLVERHRLHLDRWFYPCSSEMHRNLADLYEADARFAANIDRYGEGLTAYLVSAIRSAQ